MFLSYCVTCYNRLYQLKETLKYNILYTKKDIIDIVILVYNDQLTYKYLIETYNEYIVDGRLKIINHLDIIPYNCGYAKHLCHMSATGSILFNLDADNFIGDTHYLLLDLKENTVLKNINTDDGKSGRIGIYKKDYLKTEGYQDKGRNDDGFFISLCLKNKMKLQLTDCSITPLKNERK